MLSEVSCQCPVTSGIVSGRVYRAFLSDYQRANEVLRERVGMMPETTYRRIREGAAEARKQSEQAQEQLEAHLAAHGCGGALGGISRQ